MHVLWYANITSEAEVMLNSEKIKPVALAIIKLCLSEGIRQSVENYVKEKLFKIPWQLLKAFRVDLKACLGLVYVNNTFLSLSG